MAYNKDNYENQRLTPKQEAFVDNILQGKTQYQSYIDAYPKAKNWNRNAVDCNASKLMEDTKIKQRLKELRLERQNRSNDNKKKYAKKNRESNEIT